MPSITIRDVPEETLTYFWARATAAGQSTEEHIRSVLVEIAGGQTDIATLMAAVRARKQAAPHHLTPEMVLEYRDADRR